jgi:hypothetical protein
VLGTRTLTDAKLATTEQLELSTNNGECNSTRASIEPSSVPKVPEEEEEAVKIPTIQEDGNLAFLNLVAPKVDKFTLGEVNPNEH